jgi:hypothetical protein
VVGARTLVAMAGAIGVPVREASCSVASCAERHTVVKKMVPTLFVNHEYTNANTAVVA